MGLPTVAWGVGERDDRAGVWRLGIYVLEGGGLEGGGLRG